MSTFISEKVKMLQQKVKSDIKYANFREQNSVNLEVVDQQHLQSARLLCEVKVKSGKIRPKLVTRSCVFEVKPYIQSDSGISSINLSKIVKLYSETGKKITHHQIIRTITQVVHKSIQYVFWNLQI